MRKSRPTHKGRREGLQRLLLHQQQQLEEQTRLHAQQRLREQVLTDVCQLLDSVAHVRRTHQQFCMLDNTTTHQPPPPPLAGPQLLQRVYQAVPKYCCMADLLFKATPELIQLSLLLSPADISCLLTNAFHELLALLEFAGRGAAQSPLAATTTTTTAAAASATAGKDTAPYHHQQQQQPQQPQPLGGHPGASSGGTSSSSALRDSDSDSGSGGGSGSSSGSGSGSGASNQQQVSPLSAMQLQQLSELKDVVDRLFGVLGIVTVLQPLPMVHALTINHRTQQQEAPPAQHWMEATLRLRMSRQQMTFLAAALHEVQHIRRADVCRFSQLVQEVASPSLLLLAALNQQGCGEHTAAATSAGQSMPAAGAAAGAGAPAAGAGLAAGSAAGAAATNDRVEPIHELQLSSQVEYLVTYTSLVAFMVLDNMTVTQKAQWAVASYPWVPAPVMLCNCAAELINQQQQQQPQTLDSNSSQQQTAATAGLFADNPHEHASRHQHLQERRERWLREQSEETNSTTMALDEMLACVGIWGPLQPQQQQRQQQQQQQQQEGPAAAPAAGVVDDDDVMRDTPQAVAGEAATGLIVSSSSSCCSYRYPPAARHTRPNVGHFHSQGVE